MTRPTSIPEKRWQIAEPAPAGFSEQFRGLNPVLLQVLHNRGIDTPGQVQAFLEGRYLEPEDPFLLADMEPAVERIGRAVRDEENVVVYGDFDCDGVTATVLLVEALRGLGLPRERVRPYIPDRVDEGYGLNEDALERLKQQQDASLVITVDCGIRSVREVQRANELGLDMIVTDHHSIGPILPPALAVINPKREGSRYPERMLAGVGIAYKLAQALRLAYPEQAQFTDEQLLDLAAIGTVADIAPLLGENRKLVTEGLAVMNSRPRPGVAALKQIAGMGMHRVTAETIGFGLGPRINAAGRLAHAYSAARLLAANSRQDATHFAHELNQLNVQRQSLTRAQSALAESMIDPASYILVAADGEFTSGVVGLVASRLNELYYRPAVVIEQGSRESRGSCRSIPEFHITHALDQLQDLLVRHGGHARAAGFTIMNENLDAFCERLTTIAAEQLAGRELKPTLEIDAELALHEVDWALHGQLQQLEPTGEANPTPRFLSRNLHVVDCRTVGQDNTHLKLRVSDGEREMAVIAFRQGAWLKYLPGYIDLVYTIQSNTWNGQRELQLRAEDIRPAAPVPGLDEQALPATAG